MIFYGKSKIKDLVFLIIDLSKTEQSEIFEEMSRSIIQLQVEFVLKFELSHCHLLKLESYLVKANPQTMLFFYVS